MDKPTELTPPSPKRVALVVGVNNMNETDYRHDLCLAEDHADELARVLRHKEILEHLVSALTTLQNVPPHPHCILCGAWTSWI